VSSSALFQAYVSYYDNGYMGHLAWAAAWMCKYSSSTCPEAQRALSAAMSSSLYNNLGYDCKYHPAKAEVASGDLKGTQQLQQQQRFRTGCSRFGMCRRRFFAAV
jgi:hypothetical protein